MSSRKLASLASQTGTKSVMVVYHIEGFATFEEAYAYMLGYWTTGYYEMGSIPQVAAAKLAYHNGIYIIPTAYHIIEEIHPAPGYRPAPAIEGILSWSCSSKQPTGVGASIVNGRTAQNEAVPYPLHLSTLPVSSSPQVDEDKRRHPRFFLDEHMREYLELYHSFSYEQLETASSAIEAVQTRSPEHVFALLPTMIQLGLQRRQAQFFLKWVFGLTFEDIITYCSYCETNQQRSH